MLVFVIEMRAPLCPCSLILFYPLQYFFIVSDLFVLSGIQFLRFRTFRDLQRRSKKKYLCVRICFCIACMKKVAQLSVRLKSPGFRKMLLQQRRGSVRIILLRKFKGSERVGNLSLSSRWNRSTLFSFIHSAWALLSARHNVD